MQTEGPRVTLSGSAAGKRARFSVPAARGARLRGQGAAPWESAPEGSSCGGGRSACQAVAAWSPAAPMLGARSASVVGRLKQNGPAQLLVVPVPAWEPGAFEKRVSLQRP